MKDEKQQFNVYLTPATIKQIKHRSIDEQLSLSDLVEKVLVAYLSLEDVLEPSKESVVRIQPLLHVDNMEGAIEFYSKLGAKVINKSRDGDWTLLGFGDTELGLLGHPANPAQNEGKVELNFEYAGSLEELEKTLRKAGVTIARSTGDEGFGYQLQLADPDGLLVKVNKTDPDLYR